MKRPQRFLAKILYEILAKHMPLSNSKLNLGQKCLRRYLMSHMIVHMGQNVNIEKGAVLAAGCSIGDNSGVGVRCELNGTVTIGKNVLMGPEVVIYTRNHQFSDYKTPINQQEYRKEEPVTVGDDVWIGRRVIILPGTTIKEGAVIGAGAVIAKNIPPYAIVVGNPARIIGYRNQ